MAKLNLVKRTTSWILLAFLWSTTAFGDRIARFDEAAAMRALYGQYEKNSTTANSSVPDDHRVDLTGSELKPSDPLVVRPFWSGTYEDGGVQRAVLLTYAVPFEPHWEPIVPGDKPFSCHACTPLIGIAVFKWSAKGWVPEVSRVAVSRGGGWGLPPSPARLIKIGTHHMAIEIDEEYDGGGDTTISEEIIPLHGSSISKVLRIETGEDNAGGCERHQPADEPACYRYKKTLSLKLGPNSDYYDIRTVLHGTDYDDGPSQGVHRVAATELFRFVNGTYVSIERHGSITNTEKALNSQH